MTRNTKRLRPFVPIRCDLFDAESFRNLSKSAKVIYLYLRKNSNGKWAEKIALPYSQLNDMMSTSTISKGFKELVAGGFIEQVSKGGMYGTPSFYKLVGYFANPFISCRKD